MASIKTIWGPHKTIVQGDRIIWSFTGVYASGDFVRWTLRFYFDSRKFATRAVSQKPTDPNPDQLVMLPALADAEHKTGRVTPMLRALLKPDHIAQAMRLAIDFQRRHGR